MFHSWQLEKRFKTRPYAVLRMDPFHRVELYIFEKPTFFNSGIGTQRAGIRDALIAACKLAQKNPFHYICNILDRLSRGWPQSSLEALLPEHLVPTPDPPRPLSL